jgi:hypothetical protein
MPEVISMFVEILVSGKRIFATFSRRDKSFASVVIQGFEIWVLLV